jgi:hypothetical protein
MSMEGLPKPGCPRSSGGDSRVSLEYLVFGKERVAAPPELGYLAGHIEAHIRSNQAQAASLHDLIARIGSPLAEKVKSTAEELLPTAGSVGGALNLTEVGELERCSARTTIVTTDLDREVLLLSHEDGEGAAVPSIFGQVVIENIAEGTTYEYVLPEGSRWSQAASMLRQEIIRLGGLTPRLSIGICIFCMLVVLACRVILFST